MNKIDSAPLFKWHKFMLPFRIGHGYDIHRFQENKPLILGGILIPYPYGLEAHSDGDCLIHALANAILGALALPDIGHYFPPSNPQLKGIDSRKILEKALEETQKHDYIIAQADLTVVAQKPSLSKYREAIQENLAQILKITSNGIGFKATTHEGIDSLGKGLALACYAVCLLQKL